MAIKARTILDCASIACSQCSMTSGNLRPDERVAGLTRWCMAAGSMPARSLMARLTASTNSLARGSARTIMSGGSTCEHKNGGADALCQLQFVSTSSPLRRQYDSIT